MCNRILFREINFATNLIQMHIFVKNVQIIDDKIKVSGMRIAGLLFYGDTKKELIEIEYKRYMETDGMISHYLYESMWEVLMSVLKHFGVSKGDVTFEDKIYYTSIKRFHMHTMRFIKP